MPSKTGAYDRACHGRPFCIFLQKIVVFPHFLKKYYFIFKKAFIFKLICVKMYFGAYSNLTMYNFYEGEKP